VNDNTNVVELGCITRLDLPADKVLNAAIDKLETAVIIGWDKDGDFYFASSKADGGDVLWLIEKAKKLLLD